jgi:DNA-binding CsgD family transcriptional regulator
MLALHEGDHATATPLLEEGLAIRRAAGDAWGMAVSLCYLGVAAFRQGDTPTARERFRECLACGRRVGARQGIVWPLAGLALTARGAAEFAEARRLLAGELAAPGASDDERESMLLPLLVGIVAAELGDHDRARAACAQGLTLARRGGDADAVVVALEAVACVAAARGEPGRALRLAAAAAPAASGGTLGLHWYWPLWQAAVARRLEPCRRALGGAAAGAALAEGQALTLQQALSEALAALEAGPAAHTAGAATGSRTDRAAAPGGLSAREREVAALVAQGLTNPQIAAALVIARATASRHVEHVMAKLGVHSRAQIATWATEHGLTRCGG